MTRRSPARLRVGQRVILDGHQSTISELSGPDENGVYTVVTDRGTYRRSGGIRIEVVSST